MKTSKRLLATLVAVMIVMTSITVPTFAAFTDLPETAASYEAVNVLNKLGVINGYDDGSFKPENNVTRAEFTAMLLRTRGMGSLGSTSLENPPFPDVTTPDVSWAIGNIRIARELGIINGYDDGTFKPNNNVSYEEAIKMIVCALGYGEMGTDGAFWYSRYLMTATSLGFTDGAGGAIGAPATRATIANMLYNCLEIKLAENNQITNKTILENDLGLLKNVGYIDSNPEISLSQAKPNLRADEVQIKAPNADGVMETATYKVDDNSKYNDMLGAQITFYYTIDRNSNFKHLMFATVNKSETIEIPAANIYDSSSSTIEYFKNADDEKVTTANIAGDNVVVYNGRLYENVTFDNYENEKGMPTIGNIKLLDRDGDRKYDVIFVEDYKTWIVSSVTSSDQVVVDNVLRNNEKLELDPDKTGADVKILDANGNETTFSAIRKGSILAVKESNNVERIITVKVTNNTVSGKITAVDSKKGVTISGKDYKFSKQAPWESAAAVSGKLAKPAYGESGKYYLDIDGNIIAYDKNEIVVTQYYGYLTAAKLDNVDGFTQELRVNISTKDNVKAEKRYTITTKSKINGVQVTDLEAARLALDTANDTNSAAYPNSSGDTYSQAVKFTLGSGNVIDEIITATNRDDGKASGELDNSKLYAYNASDASIEYTYNSVKKELYDGSRNIYIGSATMLKVPENKGTSNEYKLMSINDFVNGGKYQIEAFDVTASGSAKYVVVYKGTNATETVRGSSPIMIVTDVRSDDVDGERKTVLTGYFNGVYKDNVVLSADDPNATTDIEVGDVVRLGQSDGEYIAMEDHILFRTASGYRDEAIAIEDDDNNDDKYPKKWKNINEVLAYEAYWGSAYQYDGDDGDRFMLTEDVLAADHPYTDENVPTTHTFLKSWFNSTKVYKYDAAEDEFELVTDSALDVLGTTLTYTSVGTKPTELFIYKSGDHIVSFMIFVVNR